MKSIDFLPQKYRDKSARQRAGVWRLLVVAMLGGAVGAASVAQLFHRRNIQAQLADLQPLYADAQAKSAMLAKLQTELNHETAAATLYAYLQTPWPRTQLVAALARPVGEGLHIEQFHLIESVAKVAAKEGTESGSTTPPLDNMSPATRDLTAMRNELATRMTQTEIIGTSPHAAHIHVYLEELEQSPLVKRAHLVSLENVTVDGQSRRLRFTAQVSIHPARGWTEDPATPAKPAAAALTQAVSNHP